MAEYADLINPLLLYQELSHSADRDNISLSDVTQLQGLVNKVADTAGPMLKRIPLTFRQYTDHDIHHCRNVILRMGNIIPPETLARLNAVELTFLLLAALLHDSGMVVTDEERANAASSSGFRRFRDEGHADRSRAISHARAAGQNERARAIEDALLAEYFRRLHPERVFQFLERHFHSTFVFRDFDFSEHLAKLCESHAWGVEESSDARSPRKAVKYLDDNVRFYHVRVNLQYLACCLRLGDILDFDRSRTPLAVFQHVDFTEPKSWAEWNKHLQVQGYDITPTQVAFDIPCTHPVFYIAIQEFLGAVDDELRQCRYLTEDKPRATADRYKLLVPQSVDRHRVRMKDPSFLAGAFRFQLDYENIMRLLMDRSLYPDPSLFLRELLQNALDACRRKQALAQLPGGPAPFYPEIAIWDHSDDPHAPRVVFQDNGIGMSQRIIEHYFMRVGRSYYRSPEFEYERQLLEKSGIDLDISSEFGVGILSCFLVADRFEVTTYQDEHDPLHLVVEGATKYFVIRRLPAPSKPPIVNNGLATKPADEGPPTTTGTRVTVHLRAGVKLDVYQTLYDLAVNVDYPLTVHEPGAPEPRVIEKLRWEKPVSLSHALLRSDLSYTALPFAEVVAESPIPFKKWKFSRHLRGRAWFWLLRAADGGVCPERGYLEMLNWPVPRGLPHLVHQASNFFRRAEGFGSPAGVSPDFSASREPFSEWAQRLRIYDVAKLADAKHLDQQWRALLLAEQLAFTRSFPLSPRDEPEASWYNVPGLPTELLRGSLLWVGKVINFTSPSSFYSLAPPIGIQELALHSIRLPGGIVEWKPGRGVVRKLQLLPVTGGLRVDLRGRKAPVPAVHRLFVSADQMPAVALPFVRAALRHGADLVATHDRALSWITWCSRLLWVVRSEWPTLISLDRKYLEARCGLEVAVGGKRLFLPRQEVIGMFGHFVPCIAQSEDGDGLLMKSTINEFLLDYSTIVESSLRLGDT